MKYVLLAIFVLFAAQPLRASLCDMCNGQGATESVDNHVHGSDMNHGDMQDMDCCDHDSADSHDPLDSNDSCDSMSHCGACTASVVVLDANSAFSVYTTASRQYLSGTGEPLYRVKTPPFRPPIA